MDGLRQLHVLESELESSDAAAPGWMCFSGAGATNKIAIIGGGIVGLATAYRLTGRFPNAHITVLEKEDAVGRHQTGHNSGVLHCGLYYKPGSVKARLAVDGIRQMVAFCRENAIPHEICGKLVVAADDSEVGRLRALQERGAANGLGGAALARSRADA